MERWRCEAPAISAKEAPTRHQIHVVPSDTKREVPGSAEAPRHDIQYVHESSEDFKSFAAFAVVYILSYTLPDGPHQAPKEAAGDPEIYTEEETEARQEVMYENYISSMCCVTGQLIFDLWGSMVLSYGMRWDVFFWRCLLGESWRINGMFGYVYWWCLLGDWTGAEPQYETGPVGINSRQTVARFRNQTRLLTSPDFSNYRYGSF